jgi:protein tyrosine phosphatase
MQAEIVVMVTREVEGGQLKCHRYWPDPTSKPSERTKKLERIVVTFLSESTEHSYTVRKFSLTKGKETREVVQLCYQAWPDHGVPLTSKEFLEFRDAVYSYIKDHNLPLVIHCSAGVGRTGTFMAIDRFEPHTLTVDLMQSVDCCMPSTTMPSWMCAA